MVTINNNLISAERQAQDGLLTERVEQDLTATLNEYGSSAAAQGDYQQDDHQQGDARRLSFGYGIPMAGVRYYRYGAGE